MTTQNSLQNEMYMYRSVPDNQAVKIKAGVIRKELEQHMANRSRLMAAVAVLAYVADNIPISFEERKNIDAILASVNNEYPVQVVNDMAKIAGHYTQS